MDALSILLHRPSLLISRHIRRRFRQSAVLYLLQAQLPKNIRLDGVNPSPPDCDRRLGRVEGIVGVRARGGRDGRGVVERAAAAGERRDQRTDGPGQDRVDVGTHDVRQRRGGPGQR